MLVNKAKKAFSYVCFHVIAVWRVVPYDVSLSVFPWVWCLAGGFTVREVVVVTAFVERFLIDVFGVIEAFFIPRYFGEPSVDGFWDVLQDRWWMVGFFVYI